jgi:acetyl esterase/lipase
VIGVEFRNAAGKLGPYKFPAGLNDCLAGVEWAHANRDKLGSTGQIVVCGESGGGNLSLATALKAKKEGKAVVSGVYALCPYVAGPEYYDSAGKHAGELQSMAENDGIMMNMGFLNDMAKM